MRTSIVIDDKKLQVALRNARLSKSDLKHAAQNGADILIDGMKKRAPVDTGAMRQSITSHVEIQTANEIDIAVGPNAYYWPYVEYGTGIYAEKGNGRKTPWVYRDRSGHFHRTVGQHPQPFVRPTIANDSDKAKKSIRNAFYYLLVTKWK